MSDRSEVAAFMAGFSLAYSAVRNVVGTDTYADQMIFDSALEVARDLYPTFDAPPVATKARMGGMS